MTFQMLATFVLLLASHILSDYLLQPEALRKLKVSHLLSGTFIHAFIVWFCAGLLLGNFLGWPLILIAATHIAVDVLRKTPVDGIGYFACAQIMHLFVIGLVAINFPDLAESGFWNAVPEHYAFRGPITFDDYVKIASMLTGFAAAVRIGQDIIGKFMAPFNISDQDSLPNGGRIIGQLERMLVFLLVTAGQYEAVGFLVAAKSIFRYDHKRKDRKFAEYVIIGTLLSFGWAFVCAEATLAIFKALGAAS